MNKQLKTKYEQHVEFLDEELVDINQAGLFGSQIIHLASFAGEREDIALAVDLGANPNAIGDLGLSPLHYAILGGCPQTVALLLSLGSEKFIENEFGESALEMAQILKMREISALLGAVGLAPSFGHDAAEHAKQRWLDFKQIQKENWGPSFKPHK